MMRLGGLRTSHDQRRRSTAVPEQSALAAGKTNDRRPSFSRPGESGTNMNNDGNGPFYRPSDPSNSSHREKRPPPLRRFGTRLELRPQSLMWTSLILLLMIVLVIVVSKLLRDYLDIDED